MKRDANFLMQMSPAKGKGSTKHKFSTQSPWRSKITQPHKSSWSPQVSIRNSVSPNDEEPRLRPAAGGRDLGGLAPGGDPGAEAAGPVRHRLHAGGREAAGRRARVQGRAGLGLLQRTLLHVHQVSGSQIKIYDKIYECHSNSILCSVITWTT